MCDFGSQKCEIHEFKICIPILSEFATRHENFPWKILNVKFTNLNMYPHLIGILPHVTTIFLGRYNFNLSITLIFFTHRLETGTHGGLKTSGVAKISMHSRIYCLFSFKWIFLEIT